MKKKMTSNNALKLFSLIIAILAWYNVMREVNPEVSRTIRNIPVEFVNQDSLDKDDMIIISPQEAKVNVEIKGRKMDLGKVSPSDLKAEVDLIGYGEGQRKVPVKVNLETEKGNNIKLLNFEPREIIFEFDRIIFDEREVQVDLKGELDSGYVLDKVELSKDKVELKGPRKLLKKIHKAKVDLNLAGLEPGDTIKQKVQLLDQEGNILEGIDIQEDNFILKPKILRGMTLPIKVKLAPAIYNNYGIENIIVSPSTVNIVGDDSILDLLNIETEEIDLKDLEGKDEVIVKLDLPDNIKLVEKDKLYKVKFEFKEETLLDLDIPIEELRVENLSEDLELIFNEGMKELNISLSVNEEGLKMIEEEGVVVKLDLEGLEEGDYNLIPELENIEGVRLEKFKPEYIEIKLKNKN